MRQRKDEGPPQAKNFLTSFVSHKQNVNRIVSEIEIDLIFDFLCYSHKQNINGKVSEIEIGKRKPAACEIFFDFISYSHKQNIKPNGVVSETLAKWAYRSKESRPQAKHFLTSFVSHKQNVNGIVSEIEIGLQK